MKFIKNHKTLMAVISVIVIMLIAFIILLLALVGSVGKDVYGNRLDNIKNYKIENSQISTLKEDMKKLDSVEDIAYNLEGRLINVIITISNSLAIETAKSYADKVLEYFEDEQKTYYDIQIYLTTKEESETYPIIGYKNKSSETIVWKM
ncbi:MAG: hypothetical protein PHN42_04545 [Bacilli bacterium]|nr:hypothetical protein [Bacilli bacterium]